MFETEQDKQPMTKEEIERLLIAELRTFPNCKQTMQIVVITYRGLYQPSHVDGLAF